jgi:hypothetical protein
MSRGTCYAADSNGNGFVCFFCSGFDFSYRAASHRTSADAVKIADEFGLVRGNFMFYQHYRGILGYPSAHQFGDGAADGGVGIAGVIVDLRAVFSVSLTGIVASSCSGVENRENT